MGRATQFLVLPHPLRDRPALALIEDRNTPSPLAGEGWDGGDVDGGSGYLPPLVTPTLSLPRRGGGDIKDFNTNTYKGTSFPQESGTISEGRGWGEG